ncbi:hypothetical protein R1sor_000280 [Riccia sorocarpa]|uniref:Cytochrome P450 n=1 Tax=Riccia sorocarpa TaxID=122646 RepID=A0ABD3GSX2_9MARC
MATSWNGSAEESHMTLITALAFTVLWLLWSISSYFRCRNRLPLPPGSFGFPVIGQTVEHLLALRTADGIRQWMQKQVDRHGPLFRFRFVGYPMVMMSQPEGNKFIFQNEGLSNHIFWPSHISTMFGPHAVITQSGERHKLVRRHLNRFFDRTAMSRYIHGVNRNAIRHFTNHWQGKEQLVALDIINFFTGSCVWNLALSLEEGPLIVTLALTIFYIAKNPHVYEQILHMENGLTMEDISAMKYTWGAIQETLRLHPVLTGSYRKTVTDLEYEGYHIPKDWLFNWNSQHSHYNPKYFKDPFKFDPSRWEKRPPPFTYLPFGGGVHLCLGYEFARMEMLIFIHHLV